jgi:hypothetical protein
MSFSQSDQFEQLVNNQVSKWLGATRSKLDHSLCTRKSALKV